MVSPEDVNPQHRDMQTYQVDIPGVSEETKIGDLTVGQFVQLITQVNSQQYATMRRSTPTQMKAVVDHLKSVWADDESSDNFTRGVRQAQRAILDLVPEAANVAQRDVTQRD